MNLNKAVELLLKNKAKYIRSEKASAEKQDLNSLSLWLFEHMDKKEMLRNWKKFFEATDWEIDNNEDQEA